MKNNQKLKQYLITNKDAYLLNNLNNGKTAMISGAWGSGKTYFWQNEIEPVLKKELSKINKTAVYISLYGKESLNDVKSNVYLSASSKGLLSKEVSTFGIEALSAIKNSELSVGKLVKASKDLINSYKIHQGLKNIKDGGVVCFDDFERKSKNINLNDLFGFISQLASNLKCKVIIILNEEVFHSEEAKIFSQVKEKSVNKFFYFEPTIEELFESIYQNDKYRPLDEYKQNIINAIKETEELNARIYMQVLDNILEWLLVKKNINSKIVRVITLATFNFVLNHIILDYQKIYYREETNAQLMYNITSLDYADYFKAFWTFDKKLFKNKSLRKEANKLSDNKIIYKLKKMVTTRQGTTEIDKKEHLDFIKRNKNKIKALWKYGYRLYYVADVDEATYNDIANFIKTGILLS